MPPQFRKEEKVGQVWTFELQGIDEKLLLQDLALELSNYARSIIGIYRKADYERFIAKDTVYVQLVDESEFIRVTRNIMIIIANRAIRVEAAHHLISSSIPFSSSTSDISASDRNGAPMSIHVAGLDTKTPQPSYIFLLRDIFRHFEKFAEITGAKLIYNIKRHRLTSTCFINFMFRNQMEKFHEYRLPFNDGFLSCQRCEQAQLLLPANDLPMLNRGVWNDALRKANLLCDAPLIETVEVSQPSVIVNVPLTMPPIKPSRRPMKRRVPVEVEDYSHLQIKTKETEQQLKVKSGKATILSVESLPRWEFPQTQQPIEEPPVEDDEDNVVQLDLCEGGKSLDQVILELFGPDPV